MPYDNTLISDLIQYRIDNQNLRLSNIADITLKQRVLDYPKFTTLSLQQKISAIILNKVPVCYCGNKLKFSHKKRENDTNGTAFRGWLEYCSLHCMKTDPKTILKRKNTNIKNYGVDSWAKTKFAKLQSSKVWDDKKKESYNTKRKSTSIKKYGVDHFSRTLEYAEKRTTTILANTGGKFTNHFQDVDKIKASNIKKYGVDHINKTEHRRNIMSKSNVMHDPKVARLSRITKLKNQGKDSILLNYIVNIDDVKFIDIIHSTAKEFNYTNRVQLATHFNISTSYLNLLFREYGLQSEYMTINIGKSNKELEVLEFVKSLNVDVISGDRTILNGKEIDIVIPSKNVGIEFDGLYYHSTFSGSKDKHYHVDKTNLAESKGYQLLHIFENEWDDSVKCNIWKSIIKSKLGLYDAKLFARKCEIRKLSTKVARVFFDNNHLSGFISAPHYIGLFYCDLLVSAISYGYSRFKRDELELYRFSNLLGYQVVGSLGKLLACIPNTNLISYADRRISGVDSVYNKFFNNKDTLGVSYWIFEHGIGDLKHRLNFTHKKVKSLLGCKYNNSKSTLENLYMNGYDAIYDCGNYKFYGRKVC